MAEHGVLFLCVHNEGRSQMAAAFASAQSKPGVTVMSAGSAPGSTINPVAAEVDTVISMGCGDECPVLPGKLRLDWDLADPAGRDIEFVRVVRDDIERRVRGYHAERDLLG